MKGVCPKCENSIEVGENPEIGSRITCPTCHVSLVVIWLFPLSLEAENADESTTILQNTNQANAFTGKI